MGYACQIDEDFVPNPVAVNGALSRHMLVDSNFTGPPMIRVPLPTGLEEVPVVNLSSATFPSPVLLSELGGALERFRALKSLPPGWDSHGGLPVSPASVAPALQIVLEAIQQCKSPRIHANGQGGIDLIWETADAELSMTSNSAGQFEIIYDLDGAELDEPPSPASLQMARNYLAKIHPAA
jgi:hypothetical protein